MTDIGDGQAPAGAENAGWRHAEKVGLTILVRGGRHADHIHDDGMPARCGWMVEC